MNPEHRSSPETNFDRALASKAVALYVDSCEGSHDWKLLDRASYFPVEEWNNDAKKKSVTVWTIIAVRGNGDRLAMHSVEEGQLSVMLIKKEATLMSLKPLPQDAPNRPSLKDYSIVQFVVGFAALLYAVSGGHADIQRNSMNGSMGGGGHITIKDSAITARNWGEGEESDDLEEEEA